MAGHEVDRAPERAKGSHRHWGGIEKKKKSRLQLGPHIWGPVPSLRLIKNLSTQRPVKTSPKWIKKEVKD